MINIIIALVFISLLVLVHEAGHFLFARIFGVKVFEFSIGFGKKLFQFEWIGSLFSIRLIPFGGYVRIAGTDSTEEKEEFSDFESFKFLAYFKKIIILFAGAGFNMLFAVLVLFLMYFFLGIPSGVSNSVEFVYKDSVSFKSGLLKGDKIVAINSIPIQNGKQIVSAVRGSEGKELKVEVERSDKVLELGLTPEFNKDVNMYLAAFQLSPQKYNRFNLITSVRSSIIEFIQLFIGICIGIISLFSGKINLNQIAGPIGIVSLTGEMVNYGIRYISQFFVMISINLAILNLLPFPALDGGRILILSLEKLFRKDFNEELSQRIHYVGFMILILALMIVSYSDLRKLLVE